MDVSIFSDERLAGIPYAIDEEICTFDGTSPNVSVFMRMSQSNQSVLKSALHEMNALLSNANSLAPRVPEDIRIPISEIAFDYETVNTQYKQSLPYSYIMLHPLTATGKIKKYPISVLYSTRKNKDGEYVQGDISYLKDGTIGSAWASFVIARVFHKDYFNFSFKQEKGELIISRIEYNDTDRDWMIKLYPLK